MSRIIHRSHWDNTVRHFDALAPLVSRAVEAEVNLIDYEELTVDQLRELCKLAGLKGATKKRKGDLIGLVKNEAANRLVGYYAPLSA